MRLVIYTYHYGGDIKGVAALGNSIRIFSSMDSVVVVTPDVSSNDRKSLTRYFTRVEVSSEPLSYIIASEDIDRVMVVSPDTIIQEKVDILLSLQVPAGTPDLNIMVIRPNRLLPKVSTIGRDMASVKRAYVENGYTWNTLDARYDKRPTTSVISEMYENRYLPTKGRLIPFLKKILGEILGERGVEAIDKEEATYILAFTHESANPVSNYETLETYGDGFLKGAYMWILSSTPGIIDADQITKIADYYGGNEVLADISDRLGLPRYIRTNDPIDTKVKGDVVEALIGAIAFSWNRLFGTDEGVRIFVSHIYSKYTIDVANYKSVYTSPIQALNVYLQGLRLDRKKLIDDIDRQPTKIIATYKYGEEAVGVGIVARTKGNINDQVHAAKVKAAMDVLQKKSLDRFVGK